MHTKVKEGDGWIELQTDGCTDPIIKVYTDEFNSKIPLNHRMAHEIAIKIKNQVLVDYPAIIETGESIYVSHNGRTLIEFYWHEEDDWIYGIKDKNDARKLAKHFVQLFMMPILPTPKVKGVTFKRNIGHVSVQLNGEKIATFRNMADATKFYSMHCDISSDINSDGLRSHSSKWDRSIRSTYMSRKDITQYCLLLMEYMDTWGRCD